MDILSITSNSISEGKLRSILPEYYDLHALVENNPWHKNQNVFDHVVSVFEGLEKVLQLEFFNEDLRSSINALLSERIGSNSRREILIVATILHDIAKTLTFTKNEKSGMTACPGHEMIGAYLAREMGGRFGLTGASLEHLQRVVLYHGLAHEILTLIVKKGSPEKYIKLFKSVAGPPFIELQLLAYADMFGSNLQDVDPAEFKRREEMIVASVKSSA